MKCKEIKKYLNDYTDGLLSEEQSKIIEKHLESCAGCREISEELSLILQEAKLIPSEVNPPHDFWDKISERIGISKSRAVKIFSLDKTSSNGHYYKLKFKTSRIYSGRRIAILGGVVTFTFILLFSIFLFNNESKSYWEVERLAGSPVVGNEKISKSGKLESGEWIVTDAFSQARLKMGAIGEVDIFPQSRVKLIKTNLSEYRILLQKGSIDAKISAPPKIFFVETPSATAIDLGCRYTLEVDDKGTSLLHVVHGRVAFSYGGRESIVPAGAVCETRTSYGPGTPYYRTASTLFQTALAKIDFGSGGEVPLETILSEADKPDALSLWHLLKRTDDPAKRKIYNKLNQMFGIAKEINENGILNEDENEFNKLWKILRIGERIIN